MQPSVDRFSSALAGLQPGIVLYFTYDIEGNEYGIFNCATAG